VRSSLALDQFHAVSETPGSDKSSVFSDAVFNGQPPAPNAPLIRLRHLLPPQKARGAKALDGRAGQKGLRGRVRFPRLASVACSPNESSRAARQSSAFAPTLFSGGEGGRRPDEGDSPGCVISPSDALSNGPSIAPNAPLIRLRHDWGAAQRGSRTSSLNPLDTAPPLQPRARRPHSLGGRP
jgi:hypothetical protein